MDFFYGLNVEKDGFYISNFFCLSMLYVGVSGIILYNMLGNAVLQRPIGFNQFLPSYIIRKSKSFSVFLGGSFRE